MGFLTSIEEVEKEIDLHDAGRQSHPNDAHMRRRSPTTSSAIRSRAGAQGTPPARSGYDSEGNVRVAIDETGRRTVNEYNSRKLLTAIVRDGETSRIAYNAAGMKISADLPGGAMRWTYDPFGNVLTATNTVTGQTTRKTYDAFNQMVSSTDGTGTLNYRYDSRGRLAEIVGRESYRYDGLGRVVLSGTIGREYDGVGNVVLEQNFFSAAQMGGIAVRSEYAADGTQRTVRVPAIGNAPAATYVWRMDPLGRLNRVEFNGETAASYLYSGTGRIARIAYGDFTRAVFAYDAARRPTELQIWSDLARQNLWSGNAIYYGNTLINSREFYNPGIGGQARSQSMVLTLDGRRRPVVKETRLVTRPDPNGMTQQVVTREFTEYDRTGRATQDISAMFINDTLTAVRSQRFTFAQGRISTTDTRVSEVTNGPQSVGFQRSNADDYMFSPKYTETERFTYDGNGNVISDDQYRYSYDHHGRLSSTFRRFGDTEPSSEDAGYSYDNFGRLRSVIQNARNADRYFIYDGDHVIAEYRLVGGNPVLLARYVHGAGGGEIVRMDKREDDDPARPFKTFYVHEGLTGGYNFVLSGNFRDPQIISRERWRGLSENMIEGTKTRFPYVARSARYDPFTEFVYDEVRHTYSYNYTRAPVIGWQQRREQWLAEVRAAAEETKRAQLAIMALPLLPLAPMVPAAAWVGGGASLGLDYAMTSYVGGEYSFEQGMKAFGLGAIGGGFGASLSAIPGVSGATRLGVEVGFDVASSTVIEVASGGEFSESFTQNLLLSAVGGVGGKVQAAAAQRFSSSMILGADLTKPISIGLRQAVRLVGRVVDDPNTASKAADDGDWVVKPSALTTVQMKIILNTMLAKLRSSESEMAGIIFRLIKNGDIKLKIGQFIKEPNARAYFEVKGNTIFLNESFFKSEYGDIAKNFGAMVDLTSSVIHEGVHFLGGGEIAAHLAQGQFLHYELKKNRTWALKDHAAEWWLNSAALADAAGNPSIMPLLDILKRRHYGVSSPKGLHTDNWDGQPLHQIVEDRGGFETILGIKETSMSLIRESLPPLESF